jgi:Tfp pilus assembly protein PilN
MIRVNLLPQEYRKAEATPLKQFFSVIGAAVVVALAAVVWAWVSFGTKAGTEQELESIKQTVNSQQEQLKQVKDLKAWVKEYKDQYERIDQVAKGRLVLSRKLDEIWEVVVNPNPQDRFQVWLQGFSCSLMPTKGSGGSVQFAATSAGTKFAKLSDFHEDLKKSEFYRDFGDITYPAGQRVELAGKNREPKEGWTFNFTLAMKPLADIYEARIKASAAPEGGKK